MEKILDSHIHLDQYEDEEILSIAKMEYSIEALISVSMNLESCKRNLDLSERFSMVKPAFGFHPEQPLPTDRELEELISWMETNKDKMVAVGEVGLPFFMRAENKVSKSDYGRYVELLELFVKLAKKWSKPIALHAIYSDAPIVCNLLEKHSITNAHFHWFKGDQKTTERMIANGYLVSVTPEVALDDVDNVNLVSAYPIGKIMVETDGPWPFEGQFSGKRTHPTMMKESLKKIAEIKNMDFRSVMELIRNNTKEFYR
ncbi:TatD family hydrolase [Bacillus sp. 1NLA3E]|uniref:TatD family hydrolase n=1 Tax=Bacillus sp. 1NLA3E TaxID=666686 RepID=UPI00030BB524|nr:TatD family hydrolase [Bacillus sp. 1NLA3E]AGK53365.1 Mg-dependent deoxyribonuclease [Bacillus sp. 1NLA3E]